MEKNSIPIRLPRWRDRSRTSGTWKKWFGEHFTFVITTVGSVAGAGYVAFKELYLPYTKPGLVTTEVSSKYIGETDCCRAYEVTTTLHNKSQRDVIVTASHQTIGARRVRALPESVQANPALATAKFIVSRLPDGPNFDYLQGHSAQYAGVEIEDAPVLLSAGNVATPGGRLREGSSHALQTVALVPKAYEFYFVRGRMDVAHRQQSKDFSSYWVIEPKSLLPQPLRMEEAEFKRLAACLPACQAEMNAELKRTEGEDAKIDELRFARTWAFDFAAVDIKPAGK